MRMVRAFGQRHRVLFWGGLVLVLAGLVGSFTAPRHRGSVGVGSASAHYLAADGVVVDCAAVVGRAPGLPAHSEIWAGRGGQVWAVRQGAGRFQVWWLDSAGRVLSGPLVVTGPVRLLAPPGAGLGLGILPPEVPERGVSSWQVGPACAL